MSRRLPPIQLLPAFESAARLLSISKAAQELHLTASAVSQQIKQLEEHLGMPLFRRLTRAIELTEAGEAFARVAARTLHAYREGHGDLMNRFSRPVLRLSMVPMVAHELVIPALAGFQQAYPHLDLRLETSMALADFQRDPVDAALRIGEGDWPGLDVLHLADCHGTVVASPELARRMPLQSLDDLRHHTLIHARYSTADWDKAAERIGMKRFERKADLVLDTDMGALRAAEQGLGLALCLLPQAHAWLAQGRLVALLPAMDMPAKHYFVFRRDDVRRAELMLVYEWVKARFAEVALPMLPDPVPSPLARTLSALMPPASVTRL
jgi:DNA-binding transcriptional LysR family regulator